MPPAACLLAERERDREREILSPLTEQQPKSSYIAIATAPGGGQSSIPFHPNGNMCACARAEALMCAAREELMNECFHSNPQIVDIAIMMYFTRTISSKVSPFMHAA